MYLSDYHLHTNISDDSPAPLEEQAQAALDAGLSEICVTDHWNLLDQLARPLPRGRDWERSIQQCRRAREAFGGRLEIRLGVEVGNGEIDPETVSAVLAQAAGELDFVIGSLHNMSLGSGGLGIYTAARRCATAEDGRRLLDDYVDTLAALAATDTFDVLGHVIYPLRYLPARWQLSLNLYREQLREIFRVLVETGRGLEVNTTQGQTVGEWKQVLELYRDCGGQLVTVGSDAHRPHQVGAAFPEAYSLLRQCGFRWHAVFRGRKPEFHPLESV